MFGWFNDLLYHLFYKRRELRLLKERNITVAHDLSEQFGDGYLEVQQVLDCFFNNDFDGFERGFQQLRQNDELLSGGILKSSLVFRAFPVAYSEEKISLKDALKTLPPLQTWWQQQMTPFAGGLYALVLYHVGWLARGDGYADEVDLEDFDTYVEIGTQIGDVLEQTAHGNEDCLIWHFANYFYCSEELCDRKELDDLFAKVIALDPKNLIFYASHGFKILPRWHGESMHDLEVFARQSIEKTKDIFGLGAYAMIYYGQVRVADNPVEESFCDLTLLNRGFGDLYQRFGGQITVNYHLATLDWAKDFETAKHIIDTRLTKITPYVWDRIDPEFGEEDARSTIYDLVNNIED